MPRLKAQNGGERFTIKQMEKTKKVLEAKTGQAATTRAERTMWSPLKQLGVDRLFIDESHYYKNLFLYTKMRNVGGIAQTEAQKSSDLFMKCRYLDEITGGRGVDLCHRHAHLQQHGGALHHAAVFAVRHACRSMGLTAL